MSTFKWTLFCLVDRANCKVCVGQIKGTEIAVHSTYDLSHQVGSFLIFLLLSHPDVELVFDAPTVEIKKLEALKLHLWNHSPALHFGTIPPFSRSCAAVHEKASTYAQLRKTVMLLEM